MCVCVCEFQRLSSVRRLKPFTSYKLRMLATNDIGDSVFSVETESVTTLQDGEETVRSTAFGRSAFSI